jgi:hypothetical protein
MFRGSPPHNVKAEIHASPKRLPPQRRHCSSNPLKSTLADIGSTILRLYWWRRQPNSYVLYHFVPLSHIIDFAALSFFWEFSQEFGILT